MSADQAAVCGLTQTTSHLDQIDYDCSVCGYSTTIQSSQREPPECGRPARESPPPAVPPDVEELWRLTGASISDDRRQQWLRAEGSMIPARAVLGLLWMQEEDRRGSLDLAARRSAYADRLVWLAASAGDDGIAHVPAQILAEIAFLLRDP